MPAAFSLDDLKYFTDHSTFWRGVAYHNNGNVQVVEAIQDADGILTVYGEVKGTRKATYQPECYWDGVEIHADCDCPVQYKCKHAVALMLAWLSSPESRDTPVAAPDWRAVIARISGAAHQKTVVREPVTIRLKAVATPERGHHTLQIALYRGEHGLPTSAVPLLLVDEAPGLRALLYAIRHIVFRESSSTGWVSVLPSDLDECLRVLAASSQLTDENGRPLSIRPGEPVSLSYEYRQTESTSALVPVMTGVDGERQAPVILNGNVLWAWAGTTLRPFEAAIITSSEPVVIPAHERSEFERCHLPDLALDGHITGEGLPTKFSVKRGRPVPQLVLEELGGRLRGRLGFLYGGVRVEADEPMRHVGPPKGPWYRRANRTEQSRLLEIMPRSHRSAGRAVRAPEASFELKGDAALAYLFDEVPRLIAEGVEVIGEERLSTLRVSRGVARTSFTVRSGVDWLDLEGGISVEGEAVPWSSVLEAITSRRRFVRLGSGRLARLPDDWMQTQRPWLEALDVSLDRLGQAGGVRVARFHAPLVEALLAKADEVTADQPWRSFVAKLKFFGGIDTVPLPHGFAGELRPYQQQGLNFLSFLRDHGLNGILADDMGLGKTEQTAALLLANHQKPGGSPSLVIAPTSLLVNWQAELARFAPALRTLVLHGPGREPNRITEYDVIITTYGTARMDLARHQEQTYHTLILDEAQAIKNPKSQTAQTVRAIPAQHRLCLTGTPVENHLMELWSQFAFLMPGLLGKEAEFRSRYASPIAQGSREALATLKARVGPFMLRRLKTDVATELPPRTDIVVWCDLAPAQRRLYETVLSAGRARVMAAVAETGVARNQITILDALLKLRQVCCLPALLGLPETLHLPSAKVDAFLELVDELVEGQHRALVFSQFTSMLAHLREHLDQKGIAYEYLDGQTKNRQAKVERFNSGDMPLFLISLKAGGTGLNLTGADYVIHYDPWWNPAVEDQATDRAHRIGQTRQVFNYKLLARQTIEEKLLQLQERKRLLVRDVLDADTLGKALTLDDLTFLFEG